MTRVSTKQKISQMAGHHMSRQMTCASTINGLVGLVCPSPGRNFYQKCGKTFKKKIRGVSENFISWENKKWKMAICGEDTTKIRRKSGGMSWCNVLVQLVLVQLNVLSRRGSCLARGPYWAPRKNWSSSVFHNRRSSQMIRTPELHVPTIIVFCGVF